PHRLPLQARVRRCTRGCMALHRAGLAEQRSSNRALLLSLAHGAFLHPLGQAGSYVQATKRPHSASTHSSQGLCRQPNTPSIPHPADNKVNIRVQTTGDPAIDVFKDGLQDLIVMCQHVRGTFDNAVVDFRSKVPAQQMDIDSK
ncbi:Os11g0218100, partial [Oryza sativa Japonica Group]